ncbi:DUF3159 domain-containing protein [Amycolatopsis japonica]|uniref:DUF3159 domain-containing protein n=1 Tax=Amycolatopsis japonica TaxID=208439 RepID=UPI003325EDB1
MSLDMLTRKSLSLFSAVGGWRTVAEGVTSRVVFLVAYLATGHVLTSALITVGGVVVLAAVRLFTDRKVWQPAIGVIVVGVSAMLAGNTGQAADFYLTTVFVQAGATALFLVSILVRRPMIGLVLGTLRGERLGWRRDRPRRRRYYLCTAVFLAKFAIATAALVPLYLAGTVIPLGIAATVLGGAPAAGLCLYLCWRILREEPRTAT